MRGSGSKLQEPVVRAVRFDGRVSREPAEPSRRAERTSTTKAAETEDGRATQRVELFGPWRSGCTGDAETPTRGSTTPVCVHTLAGFGVPLLMPHARADLVGRYGAAMGSLWRFPFRVTRVARGAQRRQISPASEPRRDEHGGLRVKRWLRVGTRKSLGAPIVPHPEVQHAGGVGHAEVTTLPRPPVVRQARAPPAR
jgi:hypothetical protein